MSDEIEYKIRREMPTYSKLRNVSYTLLEEAKENDDQHKLIAAMLFCAFCLEAFANHMLEEQVNYWEILKRKLSTKEKFKVLSEVLKCPIDYGEQPFQTHKTISDFRNLLVHPVSEVLEEEGEIKLKKENKPPKPLTKWEKLVTKEMAQRFLDDTEEIVNVFRKAAGHDGQGFESEWWEWRTTAMKTTKTTTIPPSSDPEQ